MNSKPGLFREFSGKSLVRTAGAAPDGAPVARRGPRPWGRCATVRGGSTPIGDSAWTLMLIEVH